MALAAEKSVEFTQTLPYSVLNANLVSGNPTQGRPTKRLAIRSYDCNFSGHSDTEMETAYLRELRQKENDPAIRDFRKSPLGESVL